MFHQILSRPFKDLPYWKKGGIIGVIASVLFSLPIIFYDCNYIEFFSDFPGYGDFCLSVYNIRMQILPLIPSNFVMMPIWFIFRPIIYFKPLNAVLVIFSFWIDFFILGAIVGWIYGKIKNRAIHKS